MSYVAQGNIDFQVIGELKSDPGHLLLVGDDRQWYGYDLALRAIIPIEPSGSWFDIANQVAIRVEVPRTVLAS